jgi:hypothetical protein
LETANAILKHRNIKVNQQSNVAPGESKVRKDSSFMYRRQALHRLQLDKHALVDHEIHSIAAFKLHIFIDDGHQLLTLKRNPLQGQLSRQAIFVGPEAPERGAYELLWLHQ